jgi:hypothetical protein
MKKLLYSGMIIVCLAAVTMPAMAKGKPQKQQKPQKVEKTSDQPSSTTPNLLPFCQPLGSLNQQPRVIIPPITSAALAQEQNSEADENRSRQKPNLRSNQGGKLRGQARAEFVHQLNQAKKNQRLAGQVPNACAGLPQLPPSATSQTSTSVEVNTVR